MTAAAPSEKSPFDRAKPAFLVLPPAVLLILSGVLMDRDNALFILRWYLMLFLMGIVTFPFAAYIFKGHGTGGFFQSKVLCLTGTSLLVWTLTYMKLFRFDSVFVMAAMVLLAAACYIPGAFRDALAKKISEDHFIEKLVTEETIFCVMFVLLCFFKGMLPDINGQEKFMDYGFIMSMLRNPSLPAADMWMSGYSINYYYFGQFIYALLIKISGIRPGVGYNLAMCSAIALPFGLCYSIGTYLIDGARRNGLVCPKAISPVTGLLTAFAAMIFGNSHSWYYDPDSIGHGFLEWFKKTKIFGIDPGNIDSFFYPDSTRYIGYNPDSSQIEGIYSGADRTIEEFPFYSYLIGDLHAHVVSTMIVLLIMSVCIALLVRAADTLMTEVIPSGGEVLIPLIAVKKDKRKAFVFYNMIRVISPELTLIGVLLGCAQMTNYWDFLIYFIFASMTLIVVMTIRSHRFSTICGALSFLAGIIGILGVYLTSGQSPVLHLALQACVLIVEALLAVLFPCALSRTSFGMSFIFTLATLTALPFNMHFDMISNTIAECVNHSSLFQLYILWGIHVFIVLVFIVITVIFKNTEYDGKHMSSDIFMSSRLDPSHTNVVSRFVLSRNVMDIFVCGMAITGILMLIAPEIFYVRDIYTGGYLRANTMFKFTYAGFIILSVAMIYSIARMYFVVSSDGRFSKLCLRLAIGLTILLMIPAHYPLLALKQRCGDDLSREKFKTLDGTAYTLDYASPYTGQGNFGSGNLLEYMDAVNWFNTYVEGPHVILESYGESYTDYDIVSTYTGLQTVCGWQTHEWLWRFHGIVDPETDLLVSDPEYDVWSLYLTPRYRDIATVYTSEDPEEIRSVLEYYDIEYVIVGDLERNRFRRDNTGLIAGFGEIVFISGDLAVIRIDL
jgi:YYY domain-containing protein